MAKVIPEPGRVVTQTTTIRSDPADLAQRAWPFDAALGRLPEFWTWLEKLTPSDWNDHTIEIRLYRGTRDNRGAACDRYLAPPFNEFVVQKRFGGGNFTIMCRIDGQLRYSPNFSIAGIPIEPSTTEATSSGEMGSASGSETMQLMRLMVQQNQVLLDKLVASSGGTMAADSVLNALSLSGEVFRSAVPAITESIALGRGPQPAPAPNPMEEVMRQFMVAAISKMMNPADPIETFVKLAGAMQSIPGFGGGGHAAKPTMIGEISGLMPHVARIFESFRDQSNNALRMATLNGGRPQQPVAAAPQPGPYVPPSAPPNNVVQMPAPPPLEPSEVQQPAQPPENEALAMVEMGTVRIINNDSLTVEDAASELLIFLDAAAPPFVDQLCGATEDGILAHFASRPITAWNPETQRGINPARPVRDIVAKFLELARESRQPQTVDAPSAPQPEPVPVA